MECKYCEKNNNCAIQKSFTEEEIGCSKGVLTIKAQKELNAFQIIKEKKVDITRLDEAIKRNDLSFYNYYCWEALIQEEFDLLKEVLL